MPVAFRFDLRQLLSDLRLQHPPQLREFSRSLGIDGSFTPPARKLAYPRGCPTSAGVGPRLESIRPSAVPRLTM
jgi:hypothetical protein